MIPTAGRRFIRLSIRQAVALALDKRQGREEISRAAGELPLPGDLRRWARVGSGGA
jgi:hypothetical protein